MIVSAHQPAYLPWLGYFDKISRSDIFVYMDTVQFEKNSYINRNQIKSSQGPIWLTLAVKQKGHMNSSLTDLQLDPAYKWQKKHLAAIALNYRKSINFEMLYPKLEQLYSQEHEFLIDLCWSHLEFWLKHLEIKTKIVRLSELDITGRKSDLVVNICKYFKAAHYISGSLGRDYIVESDFAQHNITIEYQQFKQLEYTQLYGDFIANLSVVDYCMNTVNYLNFKK